MRRKARSFALALGICLAGCATTTKIDVIGSRSGLPPLCPPDELPVMLVLWTTQWRPEQKDAAERDEAAWQGIQKYFVRSRCKAEIRNTDTIPADAKSFGRLVVLAVRELGPVVRIGTPNLVEGGTEVVVDVKAFNNPAGTQLADLRMHWQNGGPFVIKGVASLAQDMTETLRAVFE